MTRLALLLLLALPAAGPAQPLWQDAADRLEGWTTVASDGLEARLDLREGALCLHYDFRGGAGYVVARRALDFVAPADFELGFALRGTGPANTLEVKLVDASGENVWWVPQRGYEPSADWQRFRLPRRRFEFAWGPVGGGDPQRLSALEIALSAGEGGRGELCVDELALVPRAPEPPPQPITTSVQVDLGGRRALGGLALAWPPGERPSSYRVSALEAEDRWQELVRVADGQGPLDLHRLPEVEARALRVELGPGDAALALPRLDLLPPAVGASRNRLVEEAAKRLPRGSLPRPYSGEQAFWTLVGLDGDQEEALVSEDGAVELGRGGPSLEPRIEVGGQLLGWADVEAEPGLVDGDLPIPWVRWRQGGQVRLEVTALVTGEVGAPLLLVRYRVFPGTDRLVLGLRPFQVNPPAQFLNQEGGVADVRGLASGPDGFEAELGRSASARQRRVLWFDRPDRVGAASLEQGALTLYPLGVLAAGRAQAADPQGFATLAAAFDLAPRLARAPGAPVDVVVAVPLWSLPIPWPDRKLLPEEGVEVFERELALQSGRWREKLDRVEIALPGEAGAIAAAARTTLAHILINRDGPAIQPGSRSYERSWIRDGALTSAALLRFGHSEAVGAFLQWFAPYQFASGKVPCCVDRRGADPVPEHDSHGQLIYLLAEHYRFTGDRALAERLWPHVERAIAHLDDLRASRRTEAFRSGPGRAFFGLLPESISHEGYSAKPMHSLWDDFFAWKGYSDAAFLAGQLGHDGARQRIEASRVVFGADLRRAVEGVIAAKGLDFVPGAIELGDFDATSTTVALSPTGAAELLPQSALAGTFTRYLEEARERAAGTRAWEAYTPYEWRNVGALVRLGERQGAAEVFDFLCADRRPRPWNQWPEVVWREARAPKFLGDLPHGWVGSDFLRALLDHFVYEREADRTWVVGAGLRPAWLEGEGARLRGLYLPGGRLDLEVKREGAGVRFRLGGSAPAPAGGVVLTWPLAGRAGRAFVDGQPVPLRPDGTLRLERLPAEAVLLP